MVDAPTPVRRAEDLAEALRAGVVVPWFQPLVDLEDQSLVGFEALARWVDGDGSVVPPAGFIDVAESSGLVLELDRAMMRVALETLAGWHTTHPDLWMSVNLSGGHLDDDTSVQVLEDTAREAGVAPASVILEITETSPPADLEAAGRRLARLREHGFRVWFDDFGSGWSTLRHLIHLPVDGVKLDWVFPASGASRTRAAEAVTRAVAAAAAELAVTVTVEGIETEADLALARSLGCRYGQGFHWSPAVPADQVQLPPVS